MHFFQNHHHGAHCAGLKEGLGRIAAALGILSSIKITEKEDGTAVLSLESADIPEEIKSVIHGKMKHGCEQHKHMEGNHRHHMFIKDFHAMEDTDLDI